MLKRLSRFPLLQAYDVSDVDPTGLHPVRHASDEIDMEQPVFERGALHLDVIGEIETPFEGLAFAYLPRRSGLSATG